jgi:hypothetical protein
MTTISSSPSLISACCTCIYLIQVASTTDALIVFGHHIASNIAAEAISGTGNWRAEREKEKERKKLYYN